MDAPGRARNLTPFETKTLRGDYAAVCSPVRTMPEQLRGAQQRRTETYMSGGGRMSPPDAPRYYVTSSGALIAWVTMDGGVHYVADETLTRTARRHLALIRTVWPTRFAVSDGFGG